MKQPRLSSINIWRSHEKRVLEVFEEALLLLRQKANLGKSEVLLNRELFFCLLEANNKLRKLGRGFDYPPTTEGKNPPSPDDECRAKREDKIPDFSWGFIDDTQTDPRRGARFFVIECKRLGTAPRSDWILNENYIAHGINRFIADEYGYAKGEASGAMIGYVQDMQFDQILQHVNDTATTASIPLLMLSMEGWQDKNISRLYHKLSRSFLASSFLLQHLWVDLRDCYP
jgi:hypothetical protein